jgi:hypothetical protein
MNVNVLPLRFLTSLVMTGLMMATPEDLNLLTGNRLVLLMAFTYSYLPGPGTFT